MRCATRRCAPRSKDCARARGKRQLEVCLRLFFALSPDIDVATQLTNVAAQIPVNDSGRLVSLKNYHLTVAFVGEVADARLETLRRIGQSLPACGTVVLDSIEFWPESRAVVAAARIVPPGFFRLWTQLQEALALRERRFRAHVTLARKVSQAPVLQAMSPILWHPNRVALIRSDTGGQESAYTVVGTWPLLDETLKP
jgi:RNA 2',3'-cyclic 3'-phosphodiesterase